MIPGDGPHTYDTLKKNTPAEKHAARITIAAMLGVDR